MITAPLLSLFVIPAIDLLWRQRGLRRGKQLGEGAPMAMLKRCRLVEGCRPCDNRSPALASLLSQAVPCSW